ncbi:hypothetical protein V9T40_014481 [Parthenolecanium corni]|uniref:G-protein coupled receptors family 1 profile domain-containing protein n=1 Tax=Parthenolecanium corni TaxID=536013 RepID=A0AAN9XYB3_9HEMI
MLNRGLNETGSDKAFGPSNTTIATSATTPPSSAINFADQDLNEHIEYQLGIAGLILQYIQLYYTPTLIVLGCIGNVLSVFVFFSTKLRKHSSSYYLSALAFSDTGFLVAQFITWLNLVDIPIFKKSGFCQMAIYSSQVCSFLSVWLVVLFTVERFIAVRYPLHRPVVCTVARAKTFICILTMIALPAYSPYFVMAAPQVKVETANNETFTTEGCYLVDKYADMAFYYNHIDVFFTLILPFCIIVTLNTLICRTVHQLAHVRRTMTLTTRRRLPNGRHNNSRRSSDGYVSRTFSHRTSANSQSKVTHMLLVVSTVFICLNLPSYILRLWLYVNEVRKMYNFSFHHCNH